MGLARAGVAALAAAFLAAAAQGAPPKPISLADLLKASPASDWRALDPQDTLYLELPAGRVVIELMPAYAPLASQAVRALVRDGFFDGAFILRSQDNFVVQWGRPEEDERAKAVADRKVKPEFTRAIDAKIEFTRLPYPDTFAPEVGFSGGFPVARDAKRKLTWLVHCYGMVGVGRDNAPESGNGAELYAVTGHSPRTLDRNITLVGRVVQGIEKLSVMPRGTGPLGFYEKPEERVPIRQVRVAADVPEQDRLRLEALRTDSPTFKTLVDTRATRREEWFVDPVGRIGVCNVPLPVRSMK